MIQIVKTFQFSAAHRLYRSEWTEEENTSLFGKCTNHHGHNYRLEVALRGHVDDSTGMILNSSVVKEIVEKYILEDLDHKDLNIDVPWLVNMLPTVEILAREIGKRLEHAFATEQPTARLFRVALWETPTICAIYECH